MPGVPTLFPTAKTTQEACPSGSDPEPGGLANTIRAGSFVEQDESEWLSGRRAYQTVGYQWALILVVIFASKEERHH